MKKTDIDELLEDLQTSFSDRVSIGSKNALQAVQNWVPTGSTMLDAAVRHGLPLGRVVELTGKSGTGKSALAFSVLAQTQKLGGIAVLLDSECAADLDFAQKFGVDTDKLVIAIPETAEEIYDLTKNIIEKIRETLPKKLPITVVADSCTISTQNESEKTMNEPYKMGENAKTQRRGLRGILSLINEQNVLFIGINHITANLNPYGPKETTTGGSGWEFFPSVRIKIHKLTKIQDAATKSVLGVQMQALVFKNRHDFPYREALLVLDFETGLDDIGALIEYGRSVGIIGRKGRWTVFQDKSYTKQDLVAHLKEDAVALQYLKDTAVHVMKTAQVSDNVTEDVDE